MVFIGLSLLPVAPRIRNPMIHEETKGWSEMKVVVSAMGKDLDAQMDPRFGRCAGFIFVDTDTMEFEALENPNVMAAGGAGIQSAQLIANRGAEVVLTGNVGPNAFQTLSALGVKIVTGVTGTVRDAVERFKRGEFQQQMVSQPTVPGHYGMGVNPGAGPGMGAGMGGGMGGGRGMGMGRGMGGAAWQQMAQPPAGVPQQVQPVQQASSSGSQEDLDTLKGMTQQMTEELKRINERIDRLEKGSQESQ